MRILMKVTGLSVDSVYFIALLLLEDNGYAHLQRRFSSNETNDFMAVYKMVGEVAKVGDYIHHITEMEPGSQTTRIELVEDPGYYKKIFEDYENDCLQKSYSAHIREFKIDKITENE